MILATSFGYSQIIHVTPAGSGLKDGSSWANALAGNDSAINGYTLLSDTLRHALSGAEFWVAEGTYLPCWDNDRGKYFDIQENTHLYGGFFGNELILSERNWNSHRSIFSGNIGDLNDSTDNAYHVFFSHPGLELWSNPAILDGLVIQEGSALFICSSNQCPWDIHEDKIGGGVFVNSQTRVHIQNCIVRKNSSLGNSTSATAMIGRTGGGGIYNKGDLEIFQSTIEDNVNPNTGGGIFNEGRIYLKKCIIQNNQITSSGKASTGYYYGGAGIYNYSLGSAIIDSCSILNNHVSTFNFGGGLFQKGKVFIRNSLFHGNSADRNGGGIYAIAPTIITNSRFEANQSSYYGGAIYATDTLIIDSSYLGYNIGCGEPTISTTGYLRVSNSELCHSVHTCQSGRGGGITCSGNTEVLNCRIHSHDTKGFQYNNSGGLFGIVIVFVGSDGGGILQNGGVLHVDRCLFYKNKCGGGGAIAVNGGTAIVKNSIISECFAADGSAFQNKSHLTINNCLISNNINYWGGTFINIDSSKTTIENSTIVNNFLGRTQDNNAHFKHGRFHHYLSNTFIVNNSILWQDGLLAGYYPGTTGFDSINSCCVKGGYQGFGNLTNDPLFINPPAGFDTTQRTQDFNFRLHPCSPCINAGSNSLTADSLDMDGNPRIVESVDMGAYEYQVVETGHRIFGSIYYDNEDTTVVDSVWVILHNETMAIDSFQTRAPGEYCFSNVQPGEYSIECRSVRSSGGSSSIDAFLILKHFTQFNFLTGLRLLAASTDTYPWINAIDGLLVHRKFTGAIPHYNAPEWIFETKTVIMTNENLNIPIRAICRGDVDGSFEP